MNDITPESIDLKVLPSIPLVDRKTFPSVSSIYFAMDSQDAVHYIGRTMNLRKRWQRHHQQSTLDTFGDIKIAWIEIHEIALLAEIERCMVEFFRPTLNGVISQSNPKTLKFNFQEIKTQIKDGKTWFCGSDIMKAMGYKNPSQAITNNVSSRYITKIDLGLHGNEPLFISEPGLYQLIMRSELPGAEVFKEWVIEQVLPSIERTRRYISEIPFTGKGELLENLPAFKAQKRPQVEPGNLLTDLPALIAKENSSPAQRNFKVRDVVIVNYGRDDQRDAIILDFLDRYIYVKFLDNSQADFVVASQILGGSAK